MAEQAHARYYRSLPPVVRPDRRRWWIAGGVFSVAVAAVTAVAVTQASHPPTTSTGWAYGGYRLRGYYLAPAFDRYSLLWIGGGLMVGGVLGVALARGWWSMLAVDAVGLAIALGVVLVVGGVSAPGRVLWGWFFWVLGVSAGVGLRGLIHRRHVLRASFLS